MLRSTPTGNVGGNDTGYSDHRDLEAVLDCIDTEKLVEALSPPAGQRGPKGYDREGVVRALIAMRLLGIPTVSELHRRLDNNPALRRVCGMDRPGAVPSADTIRRVRRRLVELAGTLREAIGDTITELKKYLPDLGCEVAVDSTKIRSYSNPHRKPKSDPEASWGRRSKAGAKDGYELVFGHSLQLAGDANHDLPLALNATTGSRNDSPEFVPLMERFESLGLDPRVVIADRGYDSKRNSRWSHERGIAPVIHIRVPKESRRHKRKWFPAGFAPDGSPLCDCGLARPYLRTDPDTGERVYGAGPVGCRNRHARGQVGLPEIGPCRLEVRIDPERDRRLFGGRIRRGSPEWNAAYAKRWSVERVFSRWLKDDLLEEHRLRGLANVETLALLQMLATLATRLAQLKAQAEGQSGPPHPLPMAA